MKKTIYLFLIALMSFGMSHAQSLSQFVIGSSGATISGASSTLSFTVGEPVIGTISNGETLGQGFWLGAIEAVILSVEDFSIDGSMSVFPNPVNDQLTISFKDMIGQDFEIFLYDINGRQLQHNELTSSSSNETINFSSLNTGVYLLTVVQSSTTASKTFKIIKQ